MLNGELQTHVILIRSRAAVFSEDPLIELRVLGLMSTSVNSFKRRLYEWFTDVEIKAPLLYTKLHVF